MRMETFSQALRRTMNMPKHHDMSASTIAASLVAAVRIGNANASTVKMASNAQSRIIRLRSFQYEGLNHGIKAKNRGAAVDLSACAFAFVVMVTQTQHQEIGFDRSSACISKSKLHRDLIG